MSERKRLVGAIGELYSIVQEMSAAYQNDRDQLRTDTLETIARRADGIAQPIIDSYPAGYGS